MPAGLIVVVVLALRVVKLSTSPIGYEGLAPLLNRRLSMPWVELMRWAAGSASSVTSTTDQPDGPSSRESLRKVGGTIVGAARTTTRATAASTNRMRNREDDVTGEEKRAELTP